MGSSLRFAGTMEIAGLDPSISPTRVDAILSAVPRYFPDFRPDDFRGAPAAKDGERQRVGRAFPIFRASRVAWR